MSKYCYGEDLIVEEIEGKAWHDDDLYEVFCPRCKKKENLLARRPREVLMRCEKE